MGILLWQTAITSIKHRRVDIGKPYTLLGDGACTQKLTLIEG